MEEVKPYEYEGSDPSDFSAFCYESSNDNKSPIKLKDNWLEELSSYFKLNKLLNFLREPDEQKHDISISNSVMNSRTLFASMLYYNTALPHPRPQTRTHLRFLVVLFMIFSCFVYDF